MTRALPAPPDPFPPAFRELLDRLLRRDLGLASAREEAVRARHRALRQTGTFAGHRHYVPGDDLRRLDWHAYARTGTLFVKLFEEDERRATTILLDSSPSMLAGDPPRLVHARRLAAILGSMALVHLDGVHVRSGGATVAFERRASVPRLLDHLAALPLRDEPPADAALALQRGGAPGKVHWIADFVDLAATERALATLRRGGARTTGWLCAIPDDERAPVRGWTRIHDAETGADLAVLVDERLAAALQRELQRLRAQQDHLFRTAGCPLRRPRLPADDFAVGAWLEAGWRFRR